MRFIVIMLKNKIILNDRPSKELVEKKLDIWNSSLYLHEDQLIDDIFKACLSNGDERNIVIKISILNDFYNLQIRDINIPLIASHIKCITEKESFDNLIKKESPDAVEKLRHMRLFPARMKYDPSKQIKEDDLIPRDYYSFATKYCSFQSRAFNEDSYPIFDSFVAGMLIGIRDANYKELIGNDVWKFRNNELRSYKTFRGIINNLREVFGLQDYTYKQIDRYLWLYGKEHNIRKTV